jgi:hypothetical protein
MHAVTGTGAATVDSSIASPAGVPGRFGARSDRHAADRGVDGSRREQRSYCGVHR